MHNQPALPFNTQSNSSADSTDPNVSVGQFDSVSLPVYFVTCMPGGLLECRCAVWIGGSTQSFKDSAPSPERFHHNHETGTYGTLCCRGVLPHQAGLSKCAASPPPISLPNPISALIRRIRTSRSENSTACLYMRSLPRVCLVDCRSAALQRIVLMKLVSLRKKKPEVLLSALLR